MAFIRRRAETRSEVAELRAEIAEMAARLAAADAARAERAEHARSSLAQFTATPAPPPATGTPLPADPPPPVAHTADLDELRANLTARVDALAQRLEWIDARITSISTELANQLTELGHEGDATSQAAVALRDAQTKLANEQARYQIAFREDLATLADRLKRPNP